MKSGINYNYFHVFYYVAKYKSFTKVAKVLGGNQSNISRFMTTLEEQMGCQLLNRSNRGITLTPEGNLLYSHMHVVHEQIAAAEYELTHKEDNVTTGTLTIAISELTFHGFLVKLLSDFHEKYPDVKVFIRDESYEDALNDLADGEVDISLVMTQTERTFGNDFVITPIRRFREIPVCGSALKDLADKPHSLADLKLQKTIGIGSGTLTYEYFSDVFAEYGLDYSLMTVAPSDDQVLSLVVGNLGVGFIPETLLDYYGVTECYKIRLTEPIPDRIVAAVEYSNPSTNPMLKVFKDIILSKKTI